MHGLAKPGNLGHQAGFKAMHGPTVLDNQTSVMFRFVFTSDASVQLGRRQ